MKTFLRMLLLSGLICLLAAGVAGAWTEGWESYTSGSTPYDGWVLNMGAWMSLGTPAHTGVKSYKIAGAATSRVGRNLDFVAANMKEVTVDGWFYDSNGGSSSKRSFLGFQNEFTVDQALVRIGGNNQAQYQVHYYNAGALQLVNTGLANQTGWHYVKLKLTKQTAPNWRCDWQINNVAGTPYTGNFTWAWSSNTVSKVVLGYNYSTTVEVDWDDINVSGVPVPEPSSILAMATGLVTLVGFAVRRRAH